MARERQAEVLDRVHPEIPVIAKGQRLLPVQLQQEMEGIHRPMQAVPETGRPPSVKVLPVMRVLPAAMAAADLPAQIRTAPEAGHLRRMEAVLKLGLHPMRTRSPVNTRHSFMRWKVP